MPRGPGRQTHGFLKPSRRFDSCWDPKIIDEFRLDPVRYRTRDRPFDLPVTAEGCARPRPPHGRRRPRDRGIELWDLGSRARVLSLVVAPSGRIDGDGHLLAWPAGDVLLPGDAARASSSVGLWLTLPPASEQRTRQRASWRGLTPDHRGPARKFWFTRTDDTRWLFKYSRPQTGEHWSEKVAAEIGAQLGIPVARVELAMCDGLPGACSQSFLSDESALVHGNELLQEVDQTYPVTQLRGVSKHTVDAVFEQLSNVDPPIGSPSTLSAADCFVGYLLLDALIGNGDRHHENWAVIHDTAGRRLAPSYDHASSLGRELLDEARVIRLGGADRDRTLDRYAARATSAFYARPADAKRSARSTRSAPRHGFGQKRARSGWPGWRTWGRILSRTSCTLSQQS